MIPGIIASVLAGVGGDPYFDLVVSLLHFDGPDGSTTFTDVKGKAWGMTGAMQIDTSAFKFGGASLEDPTRNAHLWTASHADFGYGTDDFTIEFWYRPTSMADSSLIFDQRTSGGSIAPALYYQNDGSVRYHPAGVDRILAPAGTFAINNWYHVALCRRAGNTRLFINGTQVGATYADTNNYVASPVYLGIAADNPGSNFGGVGRYDDLRITKGAARYVTNFTPPTAAHPNGFGAVEELYDYVSSLLKFDGADGSTTFTDKRAVAWTPAGNAQLDTSQFRFGGSALLLDGAGDWLDATSPAFAFGTGDFTIECWVRFDTRSGNNFAFSFGGGWGVYTFTGQWAVFDGVSNNPIQGGSVADDTWYHVALCRRGTDLRLFVNGALIGSATNSTNFTSQAMRIGAQPSGSGTMNGWIDEFRVTSFARYIAAFTTPITQFAVAKGDPFFELVRSLNHWDGADGSTSYVDQKGRAWTNSGAASALDDAQKKFGSASLLVPGGTGYVSTPSHADFGFDTVDFTIEFWFRPNALTGLGIYDQRTALSQLRPTIYHPGAGQLNYFVNGSPRISSGVAVLTVGTWSHIAVSRVAGNTRLFVDGVQRGATYVDATVYEASLVVLGNVSDAPTQGMNGWFDDLRITKGAGRYVENFVPPPVAFANR